MKEFHNHKTNAISRRTNVTAGRNNVTSGQANLIIGLLSAEQAGDLIISKLKYFFFIAILLLVSSISFAQVFPPLEPYFTYDSGTYENSNLAAHEMILTGISFSEYPQVDPSKYMGIYLELEKQVTTPAFRALPEKERADAVLTLMYEQKLRKYQKNQTKLTVMLEDGSYNCVSASVLYAALAKAAGLKVVANRAPDHCFCSVIIDGKSIDVETTNPMGFNPGSKRQISSGSRGRVYAVIPARQYNGRHVISDRALVSLIGRNNSAYTMEKRDYNSATAFAVSRLVFMQGEADNPKDDSRADFDTVCTNYAVELHASKRYYDSLLWLDAVISRWGSSEAILKDYQDTAYNAVLSYCRDRNSAFAREIFNQRKDLLTAETQDTLEQMLFLAVIQERLALDEPLEKKMEYLREQKKSPYAEQLDIQKQIDGQIENCHMMMVVDSANAGDYLAAIDHAKAGLEELPKSSKLKSLLTQSQNNYAVTVHNKFVDLANKGRYQEAKEVVERGLETAPNNSTLKNDLKRIEKMLK